MKILVVAGEESADLHTAHAMRSLQSKFSIELFGIGGSHLQELGAELIAGPKEMAAMGFTEVLSKIPQTFRLLSKLEAIVIEKRIDLVFLTDLPEFNLRLAARLKEKLKLPIIYYISPKVWIWRKNRVYKMAKCIDLLLCVFPFEKAWFEKNFPGKLRVEYVGNPIIEEIPPIPYAPEENHIALAPGSREKELKNLLPILLKVAVQLKKKYPNLKFSLPLATSLRKNPVTESILSSKSSLRPLLASLGESLSIVEESSYKVFQSSKLAILASGTVTLEAAIVGTPMLVIYKMSAISEFLFSKIIGYRGSVSLVNLIHKGLGSQEKVVPELLQLEATENRITEEALSLLESKSVWEAQKNTLSKTREILEVGGLRPSKLIPDYVAEFL